MHTRDEIRAVFKYEPDTGSLRRVVGGRKPYPWRAIGSRGYRGFTLKNGKTIYLHRAVWLYFHDELPRMLDHRDGDTTNNRIENLRRCTPEQNQHNSKRKSNNKSGVKGVCFCDMYRKPWRARITVQKQVVLLGYYATLAEAAEAYREGALRLAKEFARTA